MGAGRRILEGYNGRNQYGITDADIAGLGEEALRRAEARELAAKVADADQRGNEWLRKAREAESRGNQPYADECYRKGNYWLDRSNKLRGHC